MKDKIINFFTDVSKEMAKVTWPSREELMESTKIVILVTLIISAFTWIVDFVVAGILKAIL
ncbi:MAG: preprotein translocase subunit SecE [Ignavibacteriales bacterium]|nr:preprotein translocase subunit SecE [Ignavibacteriales bacterium]